MSTTYLPHEFSADVLPGGFTKEMRALVRYAVANGWSVEVKGLLVRLRSPEVQGKIRKVVTLSASNHNVPIQSHMRTIEKHSNPLLTISAESSDERIVAAAQRSQEMEARAAGRRAGEAIKQAAEEHREEQPVKKKKDKPLTKKITLVHEGPMLAKTGAIGGRYASDIATQREWSDGSITYHCVRCDYEGDRPRSMASHWRKHINEDERNKGGHRGVSVRVEEEDTGYTPTEERLAALAAALAETIKSGQIEWQDADVAARQLALSCLTWDNSRRSRSEPGIREPLSDGDVLNRIRSLVDNGLYQSQQERIEAMQVELTDAMERADQAEREAKEANDELDAFAELAASRARKKVS